MSEQKAIGRARTPATVASLSQDLSRLGVQPGMTLLVHASLSAMGYVVSGAESAVLALEAALGPQGTLVMPTFTGHLSEPSRWQHPPIPSEWWETVRERMPAYDPEFTPTREMGALSECFRNQRGVRRSAHPQVSFAARGPQAGFVIDDHRLEANLGEGSPLARLYDLDGWVLLLGVGHGNNTSMHLAEYRADFPGRARVRQGAPVLENGERRWVEFMDLLWNDQDFPQIGADFARETGLERIGRVALAEARLLPQRALVDYAVGWMERHRTDSAASP